MTSLSLAILAARAHGLAVLDGVHLDLSDEEGFAASCRQGRELGFDGKTLINPKQIAAANAAVLDDLLCRAEDLFEDCTDARHLIYRLAEPLDPCLAVP